MSAPIMSFSICRSAWSASARDSRSRFSWSFASIAALTRSCLRRRASFRSRVSPSRSSSSLSGAYENSSADAAAGAALARPPPIIAPNMSSMTAAAGTPPPLG
eukprot:30996-Pelagococcus_subviridis.AAC.25